MGYLEEDYRLVKILPGGRQPALAQMEFYAFFHYGMCTYTDSGWGTGYESFSLFLPDKIDVSRWVQKIKETMEFIGVY